MSRFRQSMLLLSCFTVLWGIIPRGQQFNAVASESTAALQSKSLPISSECAFDTKKTVQTVRNQKGKIKLIGNSYVIITEGNNEITLTACNLPDALKIEGKTILFSGEVKEIYPNERWIATPFKMTAVMLLAEDRSTTPPAQSSIQNLPNGNYTFCSEPSSNSTAKDKNLIAGYCFAFAKTGNRLVGNYYDTKTLGEESVCVSGTLSNKIVRGAALESVGNIGRQSSSPNSSGSRLVNWDKQGYLRVALASQIGKPDIGGGRLIRYRSALLNLNGFYRHNQETKLSPRDCFNR